MSHKPLYIFLAALLGSLLFLTLHRVIIFLFLYLVATGYINTSLNYREFLVIEYFTLIISLMLGAWYGIWLGLSWFSKVYEERTHAGFINHLNNHVFADNSEKLRDMLAAAKERLQADAEVVEELATQVSEEGQPVQPIIIEQAIIHPTIIEAQVVEEPVKKKKTVKRKPVKKKLAAQV